MSAGLFVTCEGVQFTSPTHDKPTMDFLVLHPPLVVYALDGPLPNLFVEYRRFIRTAFPVEGADGKLYRGIVWIEQGWDGTIVMWDPSAANRTWRDVLRSDL